ncbi:MAG TPA: CUAEP/CCAEP-tail radical SAM protein [Acidimicrobiales bacterium]|nr:CUAEP/CCAEP-tail radical SAM protein [Acidimicrobiales bacterium]
MRVLLVSTYELGHQPLHVASPAGALRAAGHDVRCLDLSVDAWDADAAAWAEAVAFSVPMHTAMRLARRAAASLKVDRPGLPICLFGLYAPMGKDRTVGTIADRVIAGEYEPALVAWAAGERGEAGDVVQLGRSVAGPPALPARDLLPPLGRYARLVVGGEERLAGYVEATHGCSHRCRHCPVPVIYDGRVRTVDETAVLADIEQLVDLGARHVTFGDPDFLNTPQHARRVVLAMHEAFPELTFDCTTKVEHVLAHADLWPDLAAAGCLFVISAFESVDDEVLARLDKGHTAVDASAAVSVLRGHGIEVRPSWLPFTPWTTPASVADLLDFVVAHDLVANVDPVQYTVRLLLPEGSLLLAHPDVTPHLGRYDTEALGWSWTPADPASDRLQADLASLVERRVDDPTADVFEEIEHVVRLAADRPASRPEVVSRGSSPASARPRLTEPWFCCSEPTQYQLAAVVPLA